MLIPVPVQRPVPEPIPVPEPVPVDVPVPKPVWKPVIDVPFNAPPIGFPKPVMGDVVPTDKPDPDIKVPDGPYPSPFPQPNVDWKQLRVY